MTDVHAKPRNADGRLSRSRSGASIYWMEKWRTAKESKPLLGILQGVKVLGAFPAMHAIVPDYAEKALSEIFIRQRLCCMGKL